jgi:hypothetical protein
MFDAERKTHLHRDARPIVVDERLKAELKIEVARLVNDWRISISESHKNEISQKISAILSILTEGKQ